MEIYKSRFCIMDFNPENSLFIQLWTAETCSLSEELFKEEVLKYAECLQKYQPQKLISNLSHFAYRITSDLQEWHKNTVKPCLSSVKKIATVLPDELIKLPFISGTTFETQNFFTEREARHWVMFD